MPWSAEKGIMHVIVGCLASCDPPSGMMKHALRATSQLAPGRALSRPSTANTTRSQRCQAAYLCATVQVQSTTLSHDAQALSLCFDKRPNFAQRRCNNDPRIAPALVLALCGFRVCPPHRARVPIH